VLAIGWSLQEGFWPQFRHGHLPLLRPKPGLRLHPSIGVYGPGYQYGGLRRQTAASLTIFRDYTSVVNRLRFGVCMARWSAEWRLFAVAFVALSCSACGAHAFALCDGCPDLFANTPIAQQAALPQPRAQTQSNRLHDRNVNRRRHQTRDDPSPPSLACCKPLTAFAESFPDSQLTETGAAASENVPLVAEPAPSGADADLPATPALRIDQLFNIMAAAPSDRPEDVAALRANVLSQFRDRYSSPDSDESTGFVVPTLIALGGGLLLVGVALVFARRDAFALPSNPGWRSDRNNSLTDRARRLTRRMRDNSLVGPAVTPGVGERATVFRTSNRRKTSRRAIPLRHG
jgi:hypothetical protein